MDAPRKMGPAFFLKMIVVLIVAGILTFFVSILAGVDFGKDLRQQKKLTELASKISDELAGGINARILRLGTAPPKGSQREYYCEEMAKELLDIYYLAEKPKMVIGAHDAVEFRRESLRILSYAKKSDLDKLIDEITPLTRELQSSLKMITEENEKISRTRVAYEILYFCFVVALYWVVFYTQNIRFYFQDRRSGH
ncbi:hypothetical protein ACFL2O_05105, partial [Thermodesulfobacteriota bacterium]